MPRITGRYERTRIGGEEVAAFIPRPLPPTEPPLALDRPASELLRRAEHQLSRLELAGEMIPSVEWFIYAFVRKEAVLSSQIEGTRATLVDLLTFEGAGRAERGREPGVQEVCNYLDALTHARAEVARAGGLPRSLRLLHATHQRLMAGVPGAEKEPGEVRRSQNWIGGTRPGTAAYVPPPPHALGVLLGDLEKYIHADGTAPPLVRAALLHAQFETIHPYLDGNGRIGRLLVTLLLEHWRLLTQPLLYLSLFLKRHRAEYYRRLNAVRTDGDWEAWVTFFLDGVGTVAEEAVATARELFALVGRDRARLVAAPTATVMALRLFEELPRRPVVSVARVTELLATSKPTAAKAVAALVDAGVLVETTGRRRDRTFHYAAYLGRLRAGTELEDAHGTRSAPGA